MTFDEKEARRNALKQLLANTDYKAIKAAEGSPSGDWDEVRAKRQDWRDEINDLEIELAKGRPEETEEEELI